LIGLIAFIFLDFIEIEDFAWNYFFSTFAAASAILLFTLTQCVRIQLDFKNLREDFFEGISFSSSNFITISHAEIDKALMLKLSNPTDTGVYSAATRVVSSASLPLLAFVLSTTPRLFRMGHNGFRSSSKASLNFILPVLVYGLIAGFGLFFFASLLPVILGNEFKESVTIIRYLSPFPTLYGFSILMLGVLTCANLQWVRFLIEGICLMINIILNLLFIPRYGNYGAVISLLASQSALNIILVSSLIFSLKKSDRY
jgi:O-antigen/teichoic acid export membrane protein